MVEDKKAQVIAYVGAGGKTSSILERLNELGKERKKVIVATTTHMRRPRIIPEGTNRLTETLEEAEKCLKEGQVVWFGHPCSEDKFSFATKEEWIQLLRLADVILVEADGSRRLPVKAPGVKEPVIPAFTDRIIVVMGLHGLGEPVETVCHRPERAAEIFSGMYDDYLKEQKKIMGNHRLTWKDYVELLVEGYLKPLEKFCPDAALEVYLNQADTPLRREAADRIRTEILHRTEGRTAVSVVCYTRALQ